MKFSLVSIIEYIIIFDLIYILSVFNFCDKMRLRKVSIRIISIFILAIADLMTHSRLMLDQNEALEKIQSEIRGKLQQLSASISKMTTTTGDKNSAGFDRDLPYSRFAYSRLSHQKPDSRDNNQ